MRRLTATALLLLMLAALLAPAALASVTNPLPACCRAGGRHRCSMMRSIAPAGTRVLGESCPYRKPLVFSSSMAPPPAAETVTLAGTCCILGEFYSAVLVSHRESPHSQRAPPSTSSMK